MLRNFGFSLLLTFTAVIVAGVTLGPRAAMATSVLIAIEIAFSFDNAIINAKVLTRLSRFWQQLFLTVGLVFAILIMRFVFPIVIVMVTANLPWSTVVNDALHDPQTYSKYLAEAHVSIAAFGGAFLMVLTTYFFLDDERKVLWLNRIERPLQGVGGGIWLPPVLVSSLVFVLAYFAGNDTKTVLEAGLAGVFLFTIMKLFVDGLARFTPKEQKIYTGWAAFGAFIYLEVLDASFSFDSVLGAFAITDKVLLIALGLGVGAIWVRSLTVYMVRHGTLKDYKYLEHGAHYAIFVLSSALLISIFVEIPDAVTGIAGIGVIWASFQASREALAAKARKT